MSEPAVESETPLAELFARDPLGLSDKDITAIITDLRSKRARFKLGDKTAGSPKPPSKAKKAQNAAVAVTKHLDIDL